MQKAANEVKLSKLDDLSFRLRSVEAVRGKSGDGLRHQLALSFALIVVARGNVQLIINDEPVELDRNAVFLCVPGQTFGAAGGSGDTELYAFYFDVFAYSQAIEDEPQSILAACRAAEALPYHGKIFVSPSDRLAQISGDLFNAWHNGDTMGHFRGQIDLQEMLYYIYRNSRVKPEHANGALEYAKRYIEEHYAEPVTSEQLALVAGLSPKYFAEMFKKKYGKSAIEYVTERRMQRAKLLMATSAAKLREIAHQVGYADEFYFSRKFKQEMGVTATAYIKSRRRKLVAYSPAVLGFLVPLGIIPSAAALHPKWTEYYYREYRSEIPVHIDAYRYNKNWRSNLELLRQVPADLILAADTISAEEKLALEQIAPVRLLAVSRTDWRELLAQLAADLHETWQANRWLNDYSFQVERVKEKLPPAFRRESVVVIRMLKERLFLHCNRGMAGLLYNDLELVPGYEGDTESYNRPVALAELRQMDPGHILLLVRQDSETIEAWGRIQSDPEWRSIPAVQRQRVRLLSSDPWLEYSAHAHLRMLEQLRSIYSEECP